MFSGRIRSDVMSLSRPIAHGKTDVHYQYDCVCAVLGFFFLWEAGKCYSSVSVIAQVFCVFIVYICMQAFSTFVIGLCWSQICLLYWKTRTVLLESVCTMLAQVRTWNHDRITLTCVRVFACNTHLRHLAVSINAQACRDVSFVLFFYYVKKWIVTKDWQMCFYARPNYLSVCGAGNVLDFAVTLA